MGSRLFINWMWVLYIFAHIPGTLGSKFYSVSYIVIYATRAFLRKVCFHLVRDLDNIDINEITHPLVSFIKYIYVF